MDNAPDFTAFAGSQLIATGNLRSVLLETKQRLDRGEQARILIFDDSNGQQVDFDLSGSPEEVLARLAGHPWLSPAQEQRQPGRGRPKLGVVCREVSLLPRHWQWLEQQLDQVSADVDFLIIVLHNPPYTRSSDTMAGGGNSERPSEARLAAMLEQRQRAMRARMVVIAGHVHNYERYEHGGIMYLVSGGGGATPYTIPRQPGDFYRASGFTYHYLRFLVDGRRLKVEMHKLDLADGKPTWSIKDNFQLVAPRGAAAKAAGH